MHPRSTPRFNQEADFRRLRDFGQKFSAAFEFIGAHWRGLGRALLYIVLPAALLNGILSAVLQKQFLGQGIAAASRSGSLLNGLNAFNAIQQSPLYWVNIAASGIFVMLLVLTVYSYVLNCLHSTPGDGPIAVGQVWAVVKGEFLGSYLAYFGILIIVVVGFFLFAIPGIYLSVAFSLFYITKLVEGTGFIDTCRRCLNLVKGKWWSTFGLLFVMGFMLAIIVGVLGSMVGGLVFVLGRGAGLYQPGASQSLSLFAVLTTTIGGLLNLFIYPPILLAIAFQYFNLVERRDGVGLHLMVNQLGQAPTPVQNATYRPDDEGEY